MTSAIAHHPGAAESSRTTASYEEAVFAWMSEWQLDVRVLIPERVATETKSS